MKPVKPALPPTTLTHKSLDTGVNTLKLVACFHWMVVALLAAAFALMLATLLAPALHLPGNPNGPEIALLLLACVSTIFSLCQQLPMENVLLAAVATAAIGGAAHLLGAATGIPFGPFTFTSELGPKVFFHKLPWAIPLVWIMVVFNSRGAARLILRPWRKIKTYGFWLIGLTAALTMFFILALDPFASRIQHYWFWTPTRFPLTWLGAPLVDFASWAVVTLLILAFITPALIGKRLSKRSTPDYHPLCVWLGGMLVLAIACAENGFWAVAVFDALIGTATVIFAIRGARW